MNETDPPAPPWAPRPPTRGELDAYIGEVLTARDLTFERAAEGEFLVRLPGVHKLATMCWLVVGAHALLVEAFVMRRADENHQALHEFLLRRNARMFGVAFSLDSNGDVFLVGRLPLHVVTADELDRLLGSVLTYADDNFDTMVRIGFASSIRREWEWRVKRGESMANLAPFARFVEGPPGSAL